MRDTGIAITIILATALSACSTMTPEQRAAVQNDLNANTPVCTEQRQCEGMWSAARNWVTSSCGMKIQTMTDTFIETYNSTDTSTACRVTKDPRAAGGYAFNVAVSCGNMFGCVPDSVSQIRSFEATVNAAGEAFKPKAANN